MRPTSHSCSAPPRPGRDLIDVSPTLHPRPRRDPVGQPARDVRQIRRRLKLGGVKVTLDGSPRHGRPSSPPLIAWRPWRTTGWWGELPSRGHVNGWFKQVYDLGLPLDIHANGDAAIDVALTAHEFAAADDLGRDRLTVMVHSQFVRRDQLDRYLEYRIIPSFFTEHTYYFGDAHVQLRGKEQARLPVADAGGDRPGFAADQPHRFRRHTT